MAQKTKCPVCSSSLINNFLRREQVPVHQNLLMLEQSSARNINRGCLNLALCEECGFIFNQSFDLSKLSYGKDYDNTQTYSCTFNSYLDKLANYLIVEKSIRNCCIVEIGCGKGGFLKKLVEVESLGNRGYGFDPSYVSSRTLL